jgi:hypothetical protein
MACAGVAHHLPRVGEVLVERGQGDVGQQRGRYASNTLGNFEFDVTLSYRRLERPRRVTDSA